MSIISKNTSRTAVPAARRDDLVVTESEDEVLVYDQRSHHIHHLNRTSAIVWRLCDGQRAVDEIGRLAQEALGEPVSEELVRFALGKLEDAGLLAQPLGQGIRASSQSRRTFLRRAAIGGAVAVPAIVSITAPVMAATVHNCGLPCTCNDDCNSRGADCPLCSATDRVCCKQGPNVQFPCTGGNQPCGVTSPPPPPSGVRTNSLVQNQAAPVDTLPPTEAPPPPPPADAGANGGQSNSPAADTSGQGSGDQSATTDPPTPVPTDTPVPPPPPPPAAPDTSTSNNASTTSDGTTVDPSSGNASTTKVQNVFPTPPGG